MHILTSAFQKYNTQFDEALKEYFIIILELKKFHFPGYRFQFMPAPVVPNNEVPKNIIGDITSNDVEFKTSTTELPEEIDEDLWKNATEKDFDVEDGKHFKFYFK